jgi:SAM-dependent methyltransferase
MQQAINTEEYWNRRFCTGDWEEKGGRRQTRLFAKEQVGHLNLSSAFCGTILDFGCGLGDAIPVYKRYFPKAQFIGLDCSDHAINLCKETYGDIAIFIQGNHIDTPNVDIIIASNVFEHLAEEFEVFWVLLSRCNDLFIVVPYQEHPLSPEHFRSYDEDSFRDVAQADIRVFPTKGWMRWQSGWSLYYQVYLKNIYRFLIGRPLIWRSRQIMFHFKNTGNLNFNK